MVIRTITVLGANGTMGCNVAAIFASFGDAKVYLISRDIEASRAAIEKAGKSVRAGSIASNLVPADYSMLEECIGESDLIFESVPEDIEAKKKILRQAAPFLEASTIVATGTSGLSINELASALPEENRRSFMGMHFFNPPYVMRLCELIPSQTVPESLVNEVRSYLKSRLHRAVVLCADVPAFLGNRIGFEFINRAMQYAEAFKGRGGIDYIDAVFGQFSGRAMHPLNTADFVGLDVHKAIVDNIYANAPDDVARSAFELPRFCQELIDDGKLGRKAKELGGLYRLDRHEDGSKTRMVYDIAEGDFRPVCRYDFPFANSMIASLRIGDYKAAMGILVSNPSDEAQLCRRLLSEYIVYSLTVASEIAGTPHAADDAMVAGFGWCPPLAMLDAFRLTEDANGLFRSSVCSELSDSVDLDGLLESAPPSRYDFRRYLRAAR